MTLLLKPIIIKEQLEVILITKAIDYMLAYSYSIPDILSINGLSRISLK